MRCLAFAVLLASVAAAADPAPPHYTVKTDYRDVRVFRDDKLVATVQIEDGGPVADAEVELKKDPAAMPDLSVDTWLYHGDRRRTHYFYVHGAYMAGASEEVPGPGRPRPR